MSLHFTSSLITFCRATNSGRASFIVLDQLGHSTAKMDAPIRLPQGTQRLFDLIRPKDPIFRPAFYMALRDTLVTDDWDLATRVAYEGDRVRWRIVTTTGNLIDTSGSMTGGGKPPSSGGMKAQCAKSDSNITLEQINQLDAEVTSLQTELGQCRSEISNVERELKEVETQFKRVQMELEKSDFQLSRITSEKEDLTSRLTTLQSSTTLTREEISEKKSLERKLVEVCRRIDEMSPNRSQLQGKVKEIQQRILDVGGPGLKRAQAKVDSVSSEYAACQGSLSAKEVAMSSAAKQQTKAANSLKKAENELKLALERKVNLEAEHQEMESAAAVVLQAQERAKQAALAKEIELKEFTSDYRKLEDLLKLIKEVEVDLRSNYENCNRLLKENQSKRNGLMKELEKVRKHHEEDIKEFHIFFETPLVVSSGGEEETKGEPEIPESPEVSEVIQPLKVYTPEELVETLGVSTSDHSRPHVAPTNKRSRGKKHVERSEEEDEEASDDPKRHALDRLKGEINLMEADRDRYKRVQ
jgi:structural maintenance of chromosome 4